MSHYLRIGFVDYRLEIAHASMLYRRLHQRKEEGICDVTACTALEAEAGKAWAEERGVSYHDSASMMEVDAVVIPAASNPELHLSLFSAASELAVPVFIDKPFAQDAATGFEILRLAREKGVPLFSTSALRFADEVVELQEQYPAPDYVQTWGGWNSKFDEFVIHPLESAMALLGPEVMGVSRETSGTTHKITLFYPEAKKADITFSPGQQPYEIAACGAGGWSHRTIGSPFFDRLIDRMLATFAGEAVAVPNRETLAVLKAIDAARASTNGCLVPVVWSAEELEFFGEIRS